MLTGDAEERSHRAIPCVSVTGTRLSFTFKTPENAKRCGRRCLGTWSRTAPPKHTPFRAGTHPQARAADVAGKSSSAAVPGLPPDRSNDGNLAELPGSRQLQRGDLDLEIPNDGGVDRVRHGAGIVARDDHHA